jgi:hypothetical protein
MNDLCKKPIVRCIIAGLVAGVVSFIEHKVNTEENFSPDYGRYIKIFLLVTLLSYGVLFLGSKECNIAKQVGGDSNLQSWTEATVQTSEPIHIGNPNF